MNPNTSVASLPGVGIYYAKKLKKLDIETVEDLVYHFPFRYEDFSQISPIQNLVPGEKISIVGNVWQIKNVRTRTGKFITNATVADESGTIEVIWFNQPYLTKSIKSGTPISLSGKVQLDGYKAKLISPSYEILRSNQLPVARDQNQVETTHTGRLVPIYPETEGLSSKWLRAKIKTILPIYVRGLDDFLPDEIKKREKLINLEKGLSQIHFPNSLDEAQAAKERLGFDELFLTQILSQMRRKEWRNEKKAPVLKVNKALLGEFVSKLPFKLTQAQIKAIDEISADLQREIPTNRLLEGDVGSGKTVVAAAMALISSINGFDTQVAAPTEILAMQHFETLSKLLSPFSIEVGIWTANKKQKGDVTSGTHALLSSFEARRPVGLVVVDEQHRFGVAQRAKLILNSQGLTPHVLTMTATPIPRTLALTLYGDLDLSVLDELPKGRQKISTFVVPNVKRSDCYKFIEKETLSQKQAFIITPFVEPSESMVTVKAASEEFAKLKKIFGPKVKLGLLHGRLKSKDKEQIINDFRNNKIQILVATPVVEVGIDVPNASIIVIESADRFGLAQLHQLRGRVGRGEHKSYCFLFTDSNSEQSNKRLKSMEKVYVGFELAEIDLKMRGAGEIFGLKQSGFANFKIADISDHNLVARTQKEAQNILSADPNLEKHTKLKSRVEQLQEELSQPN